MCRLVEIDVHIPSDELKRLESQFHVEMEDIFPMDVDAECMQDNSNKEECFSHTLDVCLRRIFVYLKTSCHDSNGILM